jgi:hypothetical protein
MEYLMDSGPDLTPKTEEIHFHHGKEEELLESPKTAFYSRKKFPVLHPKVFKAIHAIRPLSPQRIISDLEQPMTGCLGEVRARNLQKREASKEHDISESRSYEFKQKLEIAKKGVSLNLKMNSLILRRTVSKPE